MHDVEGEGKACHLLGYAHYCLGNYKEAVRYYDQDLALAKDLQDRNSMARAYCNLGLAHLALGAHATALECQKYFLGKCIEIWCFWIGARFRQQSWLL
jgi:tetratricopeptide (TPR) repeat protein